MIADANIQVWLDTQTQLGQTVLVPYVKTVATTQVDYSMSVIKTGKSGNSRINQGGKVNAVAAEPIALSRMSINLNKDDACHVELVLRDNGKEIGTYNFDCLK